MDHKLHLLLKNCSFYCSLHTLQKFRHKACPRNLAQRGFKLTENYEVIICGRNCTLNYREAMSAGLLFMARHNKTLNFYAIRLSLGTINQSLTKVTSSRPTIRGNAYYRKRLKCFKIGIHSNTI